MANKTTPIVQDIVFKMKADLGNMGAAMKQIASQLRAGEYNLGEKDVKKLSKKGMKIEKIPSFKEIEIVYEKLIDKALTDDFNKSDILRIIKH